MPSERSCPMSGSVVYSRLLVLMTLFFLPLSLCFADDASRSGPPFPRIAYVEGVWMYPGSQECKYITGEPVAIKDLAKYDVLIGVYGPWSDPNSWPALRERIGQLRALNPHILVLDRAGNGEYAYPTPTELAPSITAAPADDVWLRQVTGERISAWPGRYMLDTNKAEAIAWLVARASKGIKERGLDGVFLDSMMPGLDLQACEITTGQPFTIDADQDGEDDVRADVIAPRDAAKKELVERLREAIGDGTLFLAQTNGSFGHEQLNGAVLADDAIDTFLAGMWDWAYLMRVYKEWTDTPHKPSVTVLGATAGQAGKAAAVGAAGGSTLAAMGDEPGVLRRMRFGLATTLMGDGYFSFDLGTADINSRWRGRAMWYPEYDVPLRYPIAPSGPELDGTWRREFEGGIVIVNPTAWDIRVDLGKSYRDVSSDAVSSRFVVPALDGRIFVPTSDEVRQGRWTDEPALTLAGPSGAFAKDESVAVRWQTGAARFVQPGQCMGVWGDSEKLVTSIQSLVIKDDRYQNFRAEDEAFDINDDGSVVFRGKRTDGEQSLEYTLRVTPLGRSLDLEWRWKALTAVDVSSVSMSARFPAEVFAGTTMLYDRGERNLVLPQEPVPGKHLVTPKWTDECRFQSRTGEAVTMRLPAMSHVVDERVWGGSNFAFGVGEAVKLQQGEERVYRFSVTVDSK